RGREGEVRAGGMPERLARNGPNARGEEIEKHEHEGPTRRGEATQDGPEDERGKYFDDGRHDVAAVNEKAEVERVRSREHERGEERQREDAHARGEDRADVIVRARCGWTAKAPLRCRRRRRGGLTARAEEIGLPVARRPGRSR